MSEATAARRIPPMAIAIIISTRDVPPRTPTRRLIDVGVKSIEGNVGAQGAAPGDAACRPIECNRHEFHAIPIIGRKPRGIFDCDLSGVSGSFGTSILRGGVRGGEFRRDKAGLID